MEKLNIAFGVASLVSFGYALIPNILHKEVKHRKMAWMAVAIFLTITIILYIFPINSEPTNGMYNQTDAIQISERENYIFQVYYPRPYSTIPNLKLKLTHGHGKLEIVEQRKDGFSFKSIEVSYNTDIGAHVQWTASGYINE